MRIYTESFSCLPEHNNFITQKVHFLSGHGVRNAGMRTAIKQTLCNTMTVAGHDTIRRSGCHCLFSPLPAQSNFVA
jgi:hypothetical protein